MTPNNSLNQIERVLPLSPWSELKLLSCPSDKSLTHRAVIFAAMAKGTSLINQPLLSEDCLATCQAMIHLGVEVSVNEQQIKVVSKGWDDWQPSHYPVEIDCGNSGTTARLLIGLLSATPGLVAKLTGDKSLSKRPMARVVVPLRLAQAKIEMSPDSTLPITITGSELVAMAHNLDKASAQVKSAILLAAMNIHGETNVCLPCGARDHTELLLDRLGARIDKNVVGDREHISIHGPWRPKPQEWSVPKDPSSAAFWVVLAVLHSSPISIQGVLVNPTRTGFLSVLQRMGVGFEFDSKELQTGYMEPVSDLIVTPAILRATTVKASEIPTLVDEVPILAVAAAFADGVTKFEGVGELRVKESDRLAQTLKLLTLAEVKAEVVGDDLLVYGGKSEAEAFCFDSQGDHRLAMAAAILATKAKDSCQIVAADSVAVSYPRFFDELRALG